MAIGLIHFSCYCGADLFYLGNDVDGKPSIKAAEQFQSKLGPGNYGFFTSANGQLGECPHCDLIFELPDPDTLDWLPFVGQEKFLDAISSMLGRKSVQKQRTVYQATMPTDLL